MTLAELYFIDVGQGDCTLMVDSLSRAALIVDCPSHAANRIAAFLRTNNLHLAAVLVTHWDRDHYGGVARLARSFLPPQVFYNHDTLFPEPPYGRSGIRSTLKTFLNLPPGSLNPAAYPASGSVGSIKWRLLAPTHAEISSAYVKGRRNEASAVVEVLVGNVRILIGGDAVASTWSRLLSSGLGQASVLRWPHHGAELHGDPTLSIAKKLLSSTNPDATIVSVGAENTYAHPHLGVISAAASVSEVACTQRTSGCSGCPASGHTYCGSSLLMQVFTLRHTLKPTVV
ncbi:ComEC/Rec2 family competence protein [Aquipuribacter sp. SD81]|uniref:ComEC/Rec2 family competence protein n=1 Tax=Aquipuribacter sp. SD81 TaxID=3127703 RepID=UPI00301ABD25